MKLSTLRRSGGIATAAVALSVSLVACGNEADDAVDSATDAASSAIPSDEPSEDTSTDATDAGADTFGDGCANIPADGEPGSFNDMVVNPVATAASSNPLLTQLVALVGQANLVDTLNGLEAATVFAPTDDAFAAFGESDPDTLDALLADNTKLAAVLTHHVLGENDDPDAVVGEKDTLNSDTVTVEGDTDGMTVSDGAVTANVICGNIPTANATVYVIDQVLAGATLPSS